TKPPRIKPFHFSGELSEGLRTAVMCVIIDGDRPFEFTWFKDGEQLKSQRNHFSVQSFDEFTSFLTIEHLNADSNGNYTCRVTNSVGSDEKSDVLTMRGLKPPKIKPFNFSGELNQGLRTAVMCVIIDGDRPFDFRWFKDGDLLQEKDHFSIQLINEFTSILTIERLNADSNGNYTCRVTNSVGVDEKSDVLTMKGLKPPTVKPFHFSGELKEGLRIMVMCGIMDGDGPFNFRWFKDGEPLISERGYFSIDTVNEFTSILTIEHLNAGSNGNYTCRVTNSAGSDENRMF
ncbi:titin, partial [Caerostris extrusa]